MIPEEWKQANIMPIFKKDPSVRPVTKFDITTGKDIGVNNTGA